MGKPQHLQDNRGTERRISDKGSEPRKELNFRYKRQRPNRFVDISQLDPSFSAETNPTSSNTCVEKWHYWPMYGILQAKCYTFNFLCLDRISENGNSFCKPVFAHKDISLPSKETIRVRYIKNCTCE